MSTETDKTREDTRKWWGDFMVRLGQPQRLVFFVGRSTYATTQPTRTYDWLFNGGKWRCVSTITIEMVIWELR